MTKGLYAKGYQRQDIINLFQFIDWVMNLPEPLEIQFWQELYQLEEERQMPYITSVERIGFNKGKREGKQEGKQEGEANLVLRLLNRRMGQVSTDLQGVIRQLSIGKLEDLGEALLDFNHEADLVNWLNSKESQNY